MWPMFTSGKIVNRQLISKFPVPFMSLFRQDFVRDEKAERTSAGTSDCQNFQFGSIQQNLGVVLLLTTPQAKVEQTFSEHFAHP